MACLPVSVKKIDAIKVNALGCFCLYSRKTKGRSTGVESLRASNGLTASLFCAFYLLCMMCLPCAFEKISSPLTRFLLRS